MRNSSNNIQYSALKMAMYALMIFFLIGCKSIATDREDQSYESLKELVKTQNFEIEHQWALPIGGNRINLMDNPNFIHFSGDSVNIFLPYFGVRQSGVNYGSREGGIVYEGLAKNLRISENPEKENVTVRFESDDITEHLQFYLVLYPNRNARTSVTSSQRSAISYQGVIKRQKPG